MEIYQDETFQSNKIVFSLVMATSNRKQEVENFIISLLNQSFDIKKVELIIVDQNKKNLLDDIVNKYSKLVNIVHVRSDVVGASINRNIGIKKSTGEILAFPDDDCQYYSDTLNNIYRIFCENKNINTVLGQIFDRDCSVKVIRNWPDKITTIKQHNFFFLYSCITVFTKNKEVLFDTALGPVTRFAAYEDADYVLSLIKSTQDTICYFPEVQVNHPQLDIDTMNIKKIKDYGMGFGGFCRKNMSFNIFFLLVSILGYHFFRLLLAAVILDVSSVKKRYYSIASRIRGMYCFN